LYASRLELGSCGEGYCSVARGVGLRLELTLRAPRLLVADAALLLRVALLLPPRALWVAWDGRWDVTDTRDSEGEGPRSVLDGSALVHARMGQSCAPQTF
jgi:hypothetical protein